MFNTFEREAWDGIQSEAIYGGGNRSNLLKAILHDWWQATRRNYGSSHYLRHLADSKKLVILWLS